MDIDDKIEKALAGKEAWEFAEDELAHKLLGLKYLKSIADSLAEIVKFLPRISLRQ